ncbi:MAG: hypothetical protein HC896_16550 [Bacteroidales bacterium]|nr:hypothetical protein [Bacteroidales bacterium]
MWFLKKLVVIACLLLASACVFGKELQFDKLDVSQGLSNNWITCFFKDSRGLMWVGTWDGLNKYDSYTFTNYLPNETDTATIAGSIINAIYEDHNGNLWVATSGNYISVYDRQTEKFNTFMPTGDGLDRSIESAYCFLRMNDSILLIGTEHGLDVYNFSTQTIKRLQHKPNQPGTIAGNIVNDILMTKDKVVWFATDQGLSKLTGNQFRFRNYVANQGNKASICHNYINCLHESGTGQLLIGTKSGLSIYRPDKDSFTSKLTYGQGQRPQTASFIRDIADNGQGEIYVATDNGLVVMAEGKEEFFLPNYIDVKSISSTVITRLFYDEFGTLWAGTYNGGINYTNNLRNKFKHIKVGKGDLTNPYVYSVTEDKAGNIWIGTEKGLNVYGPTTGEFNALMPLFKKWPPFKR